MVLTNNYVFHKSILLVLLLPVRKLNGRKGKWGNPRTPQNVKIFKAIKKLKKNFF